MKRLIAFAALLPALFACNDSFYKVAPLSGFEVSTEKDTYKAGERVTFNLKGDADFVVFYSGEEGSAYDYRNKHRLYPDEMRLSFSTATYPDNGTNPHSGRLLWSNDFPGVYDPEWIKLSTWHDITDRIVYPLPSPTYYTLYDTEDMDISDIFAAAPGEPVYFCWEFHTEANSIRNRFRIDNWHIYGRNTGKDFYSFPQCAFVMVEGCGFDVDPSPTYFPKVTDKYIVWDGISKSSVYKEGWAVSGPISYAEAIDAGKDSGVALKAIGDPVLREYNYYFAKPGTYEVVFEAMNINSEQQTSAIARKTITIEESDTPQDDTAAIQVSSEVLRIAADATNASFNLKCASSWTVTSSDPLVSVSPASGNAGDLYIVTVTIGNGAPSESALTITSGEATKTIKVVIG